MSSLNKNLSGALPLFQRNPGEMGWEGAPVTNRAQAQHEIAPEGPVRCLDAEGLEKNRS